MEELKQSSAKRTFSFFKKINSIPRCSGHEEKISDFLEQLGQKLGFETIQDPIGNIIIRKPASEGFEQHPMVCLQAHMDMVCEKTLTCTHDFLRDPIDMYIDNGFLRARGTTLGADDGIGIALALDIMTSPDISHPDLELLVTRTEETGMDGVIGLSDDLLKAKKLINIDTEDEGVIIVGCAGGINAYVDLPLIYKESEHLKFYKVSVSGLNGGHSGITIGNIHLNAIKLLNELIKKLNTRVGLFISDFNGGTKHNAIPTKADCIFAIEEDKIEKLMEEYDRIVAEIYENSLKKEADLNINIKSHDANKVLSKESTNKILNLNGLLPHGINTMTLGIADLVESSNNLAIVSVNDNSYNVSLSIRSTSEDQKQKLIDKIEDVATLVGAKMNLSDGYDMWKPNFDSPLLEISKQAYEFLKKEEVKVKTIHAGLETGMIAKKYPNMDMVSLGPDIFGAHTPEERVSIRSVEFTRDYIIEILKRL